MKAIIMKKTKTEKMEETSKNHLLGIMEDELSITGGLRRTLASVQ